MSLRPRLFVLWFFRQTSFRSMISKKYQELLVIIYIIIEIVLLYFLYTILVCRIQILSYFYHFIMLSINGTLFVRFGFLLSVNP